LVGFTVSLALLSIIEGIFVSRTGIPHLSSEGTFDDTSCGPELKGQAEEGGKEAAWIELNEMGCWNPVWICSSSEPEKLRTGMRVRARRRSTWCSMRWLRMVSLSITFMATGVPVSESTANLTLAKLPCPMVRPISYRPTRFFRPPVLAIPRFSDRRLLLMQPPAALGVLLSAGACARDRRGRAVGPVGSME
jgi:hypothetical protein